MSTMERFNSFLKEVRVEARKVTWPSRGELWESTLVVLVTVAIISCFIALVDHAVSILVTLVIK
jgi:preprotein translocase subunit SecE